MNFAPPKKTARLFLCVLFLRPLAFAFETDQYNLPPAPLADIGAEVSEYAEENLRLAIDKINLEIAARQNCLKNERAKPENAKCDSAEKERAKLAALQTEDAAAGAVFNRLGAGFPPFTKSGSWMEKHQFRAQPARYKTNFSQSIFAIMPSNYLTISSTVNLYGAQFGTDKIAHVFQQGYSYYKIYKRASANGGSDGEAIKKAVAFGKRSEQTFYGFLISGVYSNADLCANFVGLKFYLNLTREIKIEDRIIPPILLLKNGFWALNGNRNFLRRNLLKLFVSNHFNEALNPSIFVAGLRFFVRRTVEKQSCKLWREQFPDKTRSNYENETRALALWHGEDYGFKRSGKFITIANACFDAAERGL